MQHRPSSLVANVGWSYPLRLFPMSTRSSITPFLRPVVLCTHAIYGHSDAGTSWEAYCEEAVQKKDFESVGENCPSA